MDQVYKPFLDRNGAKTLPFRAAHTSMAYVREYPPEAFRYTAVSGARVRLKMPAPIHANLFSQRPAERPGITSVVPFILIDGKRTPSPVFVPVSRNGNLNPSQPVFGMSRFKKWRTFKKWLWPSLGVKGEEILECKGGTEKGADRKDLPSLSSLFAPLIFSLPPLPRNAPYSGYGYEEDYKGH